MSSSDDRTPVKLADAKPGDYVVRSYTPTTGLATARATKWKRVRVKTRTAKSITDGGGTKFRLTGEPYSRSDRCYRLYDPDPEKTALVEAREKAEQARAVEHARAAQERIEQMDKDARSAAAWLAGLSATQIYDALTAQTLAEVWAEAQRRKEKTDAVP